MTEHTHAEVLRAIADGKKVQCRAIRVWRDPLGDENPISYAHFLWRVKPEDFKTYLTMRKGYTGIQTERRYASDTVCFTFDSETGNLKSAEVLE